MKGGHLTEREVINGKRLTEKGFIKCVIGGRASMERKFKREGRMIERGGDDREREMIGRGR